MEYAKECTELLIKLNSIFIRNHGLHKNEMVKFFESKERSDWNSVSNNVKDILFAEGFIRNDGDRYYITYKGVHFINTDSFEDRTKRWQLEKELKEKSLKKMKWDVSKMKITYYMALGAFAISILNFLLGLTAHQVIAWLSQLCQ